MPFLIVNGIELGGDIAADSVEEMRREIGETTSAFDGTLRKSRQGIKRDLKFDCTPMTSAAALAWESYLQGRGEYWSFDANLYSSKGLGPNAGYTASQSAGTAKFGAGCLRFVGAQTAVFAASLGSNWTVALWRRTDAGGTYIHHVVCSDGKKWVDGVRNDGASTTFISVSSGSLTLSDTDSRMDDVVALPFLPVLEWPEAWGVTSSAFSALPSLTISGDIIPEASTRLVMGSVSMIAIKAYVGGSFSNNAKILSIMLSEV